ncbi:MAG: hypothetical protein WBC70_03230 [Candidatus Aminicenantales bacterium]
MDRKSIIYWRDKYDREEDKYNKGEEEELRANFRKSRHITKEELIRIVKWKFQGRLEGRQKRILKLLNTVDDEFIIDLSRLAFKAKDDKKRVKLLCTIDGVGTAVASTILAFYNPENYGVFDIHAWRELFGKEPNTLFTDTKSVFRFFDSLREIALEMRLPCRDVEKALFKKNFDEG